MEFVIDISRGTAHAFFDLNEGGTGFLALRSVGRSIWFRSRLRLCMGRTLAFYLFTLLISQSVVSPSDGWEMERRTQVKCIHND